MGTIATIALVILGISFMVFVTFFGRLPALRYTSISTARSQVQLKADLG